MTTVLHQINDLRPFGGFDLIMADPPWRYEMRSEKGHTLTPGQVRLHDDRRDRGTAFRRTGRAELPAVVMGPEHDAALGLEGNRGVGIRV